MSQVDSEDNDIASMRTVTGCPMKSRMLSNFIEQICTSYELSDEGLTLKLVHVFTSDSASSLRLRIMNNCLSPLVLEWNFARIHEAGSGNFFRIAPPAYIVPLCESRDRLYNSIHAH
jgi:hypothetical protein